MPKKSGTKNPFSGRWRIVSMDEWDQDFVDAEVEGFFEFGDEGNGEFHFGFVHGHMDCLLTTRGGEPAVEWSWNGNDEMDAAQGRGWAILEGDDLHGKIYFHCGDDSGFVARKKSIAPSKPKKKETK